VALVVLRAAVMVVSGGSRPPSTAQDYVTGALEHVGGCSAGHMSRKPTTTR